MNDSIILSGIKGGIEKKHTGKVEWILYDRGNCAILSVWGNCVTRWKASLRRREVVHMSTYEVLTLLMLFGTFLVALLAYIDRDNKRK